MSKAICIENLCKSYPGVTALDQVSFSVDKGTVHGFLGPNGAGKSTTMNIITGLTSASSGNVDLGISTLGFLPEHPPLYGNMKVRDYLQFVDGIKGGDGKFLNHVIEKCRLNEVEGRLIGNLSKGFRQRVGIAQALVSNPDIIILDEPTVGLDPIAMMEVRELISDLKKDHTILLSSHLLHEVTKVCSHITIINKGKILASGKMEDIRDKFQQKDGLRLLLQKWDSKWEDELVRSFGLGECQIKKIDENYEVMVFSGANVDYRAELSEYIVSKKMGLLGLEKIETGLEDIFKSMAENNNEL